MKYLLFGLLFMFSVESMAQKEQLPYYEIPEYPESYTAGAVAARMIDGLGFRYYHATDGLRAEDLEFKPNAEARTSAETIDHILGLSNVIVNAALKQVNDRTRDRPKLTYEQKRKQTLINLKTAADALRNQTDLTDFKIIFKSEKGTKDYPFWNNINGPIADALWHCGQVVSFRRSSGNPFNSKVSVFNGIVRE